MWSMVHLELAVTLVLGVSKDNECLAYAGAFLACRACPGRIDYASLVRHLAK